MSRRGGRRWTAARLPVASALVLASLALPWSACLAQTQSWVPGKGHGSVSIAYQELHVGTHNDSHGNHGFPGYIDNHAAFLDVDYGVSDRLALRVGLPFKSDRFVGRGVHNPGTLYDDHGENFQDDGRYHAGWQDWNIALRYLWRDKGLRVTPFVSLGFPAHDYNTFAHSALGTNQRHLQLGVNIGRQFAPPFQDVYFQAGYAYSIMQKVEDRRVNHSTINGELGWFISPRLSASVVVTAQKTHNGFDFPEDYPNRRDDHFYHHDQNLRNDFVNVGAGLNFQATPRYSTFLTWGHTVWGENAHLVQYAWTLGVARAF